MLLVIGIAPVITAQQDTDIYGYWTYYNDNSNSMYRQLADIAFEQLKNRRKKIQTLSTKPDWINRQQELRTTMTELFGEFLERTPLNPVVTGKITRSDVIVEKLYFESRPGYYVTAALFLPAKSKRKMPAVVYCSGHSPLAFRSKVYQHIILNLVRKGFVVFAFDPIGQGERFQYFDDKGKKLFEPTHEHSYPGTQIMLTGESAANYFIWDGIRAIDYLVSRKEVDASRIGITGRSGGGTQSAYIAAFDDRIVAAAPECYLTDFDKLLRSRGPQDAEQIPFLAIRKGFDLADLIAVRAPKPLLMVTTSRDIFSIQGARDVYDEVVPAYRVFGQENNLSMVEDDDEHVSTRKNREAVYAFFQYFLSNPGNVTDTEVTVFEEKELWVTPKGQLEGFIASESLYSLNRKRSYKLHQTLQNERNDLTVFDSRLSNKIVNLTGYTQSYTNEEIIFSGRIWHNGYAMEKYLIKGKGNYHLPVLRLTPRNPTQTMLFLDEKGKAAAVKNDMVEALLKQGYEVIIPDLTGIGELGGGYKGGDSRIHGVPLNVWYAGVLTGKTPLGVRMEDIDVLVSFIKKIDNFTGRITGLAYGVLTSDLMHATAVNHYFDKIVLIEPLSSWFQLVQEKKYDVKYVMSVSPGVIGSYDIPDLVRSINPDRVLAVNPLSGIENAFKLVVSSVSTNDIIREVLSWLETTP